MQGICQRCPLSLVLSVLAAEVLAHSIDADKRIKGIQIGDHEIKLENFADDITIFLDILSALTEY